MVASAVGVPTPTSAYSTSQACFSTCWMVGSARRAAASSAVDAMIGLGITVADVRWADLAGDLALGGQDGLQVASTPPVSVTMCTGPTAPKLVAAITLETCLPQPTPRFAPGRRWVLMNWAPPRPTRAFMAW